MADKKRIDEPTGTHTVGHEWDGIEELNTPLPRWWVWTFYVTIVWAVIYSVLFPAWPMIERATAGTLGWSSRGELNQQLAAAEAQHAPVTNAIAAKSLGEIVADKKLRNAAIEGGSAAFKVHCVQCHGTGADGVRPGSGYPNLNDDDWLWGGDIDAIHYTLVNGIRNPDHGETRTSQMPAFGDMLAAGEINAVAGYVRSLSGLQKAPAGGAEIFANNCAACHGADGKGGRSFGAPNLTDGIWLYGGDPASVQATVAKSRAGVMPRWGNRLDPVTIKMLAVFVHSRGGGEATPAADPATDPAAAAPAVAAAPATAAPATK